jgi:Icc-related predicted phosphoesterase
MKILTVSDFVEPALFDRFDAERFSGVNLILSCGDLPPEYLSFLVHALNASLYYVKGNHDIRHSSKPPDGCINLNAKLIQFQGINILGLEGSRWYNGGPYQYTERQMRKTIRGLRTAMWFQKGIDIIITHAPPRHVHDAEDRCHRGFESFRWLIDKHSPRYFIHGHTHANFNDASQRITIVNKTKVVNSYGYYLFEIEDRETAQQS